MGGYFGSRIEMEDRTMLQNAEDPRFGCLTARLNHRIEPVSRSYVVS